MRERKIGDDAERLVRPALRERIRLDHDGARARAPEPGRKPWVGLDRAYSRTSAQERRREHPGTGSEVEHEVASLDAGVANDRVCEAATAKKMPSARPRRCAVSGGGHGPSPSS
jgi:hypothetical protein